MMYFGNRKARKKLLNSIEERKHVILHGKSGTGKTEFIKSLSLKNTDIKYIYKYPEIFFTKQNIFKILNSRSLLMNRVMVILDNFDTVDKKRASMVINACTKASNTVIIICNDITTVDHSYYQYFNIITFERISIEAFKQLIDYWLENKVIRSKPKDIEGLYEKFDGDVRKLKNNFEHYSESSNTSRKRSGVDIVKKIFKESDPVKKQQMILENIEKIKLFIEYIGYSIPNKYREMSNVLSAFNVVSRASTFLYKVNEEILSGLLSMVPKQTFPPGKIMYYKVDKK